MNDLLLKALTQFGVREVAGVDNNNPEILKYFKEIGQSWVKNDEMAWCSAFINWCAKASGYEYTGALNARSWLAVGRISDKPEMGDIVILWRESKQSWKGHVGILIKELEDSVLILGGNQGNEVSIKAYPKERVLSIRKLRKA